MTTDLGDGIALLDLRINEYFTLNGVGAFLWRQLQAPQSRAALIDAVLAEYQADPANCASDIDSMLGDLIAAKLVEVR
ncbi:MAG: PqqD family protein [Devosia sp.]|nr:PqqD family protein [Devosia sp.]